MKFNLALLFILLFNLYSCRKADSPSTRENILNVAISEEVDTLDPANSYDTISASVIYQAYEPLYEYHYLKRPYTLQPLLAADFPTISNSGKTYKIPIKKNIYYHDNPVFEGKKREVIAQDFINQIKRLAFIPTKSNGWWLFDGKIEGINEWRKAVGSDLSKFESESISGLKALDNYTLEITLTTPYPQMMYALAMTFTAPMPMEIIKKYNNILNDVIIGTGPFLLKESKRGVGVKLAKNPNYRSVIYPGKGDRYANAQGLLSDAGKKLPFLNGVHYKIKKESNTRWLEFLSGNVDILVIPKDNFDTAISQTGKLTPELESKNIRLQIAPTLIYWWLSFNMKDPVVGGKKNKNLRLAIAHAVDIAKYIEVFTNNVGQRANSIYPPGISGYNPSNTLPYSYNQEKAKEYLAKAGYPNGKGLPEIKFDVRGAHTTARQQGVFIKRELEKVGFKIKVVTNTFPGFLSKSRNGNLQFWLDGWAMDYPDAENSLQLLSNKNHPPGPNSTYYSNDEFEKIFSEIKLLPDGAQKTELMNKAEQLVIEDMPWVMLYYARNYILYQNHVKNFRRSDLINNTYKYLKIAK